MAAPMPRGCRSVAEYSFREEQTDAIVRAAAYHRKDFCRSVIWFSPREHAGIRMPIATPFPQTSSTGLGSLDRLPLELLYDVLLRLDMYSIFNFRQTNLKSRETVDSLKEYQAVVSHGLSLLCALSRTRLAVSVSLSDFYREFCTKACTLCGEFGGFISLLPWTRCCFKCLQAAPETQLQPLAAVRKQFHLTKAQLDQLASFKTLPGTYSTKETGYRSRTKVVSVHQAKLVSGNQPHPLTQTLVESNTEYRVRGVKSLSKKTSSARGARNGHLRLATRYMRKMAFWSISDSANRHSSCGDRVAKVKTCQLSYQRLL
ncbi:F-box domain protein [Lasiosphaeria miniovina]|uniref:F-box domain protein n=1 Tax=Lasiosphaeria miniovina TaxID=1954250 RepID=A0AA40A0Y4_9PEZI|nr:F-box domain protein [Lasiosphaeria miniovina]KAK0707034.1 F-box domain protein [Lasiosphaeria miniovina]